MSHNYTLQDELRFWSKVDRKSDPDACWEWKAAKFDKGHGAFSLKHHNLRANRVAWGLTFGTIPDGLNALHKCDNPPCCNPNHLFLGTKLENNRDRHNKGRSAKGEKIGTHKLTQGQVIEIRRLFSLGNTTKVALGKQFGVSDVQIGFIVRGKSWR